jgi:hypothetical protein
MKPELPQPHCPTLNRIAILHLEKKTSSAGVFSTANGKIASMSCPRTPMLVAVPFTVAASLAPATLAAGQEIVFIPFHASCMAGANCEFPLRIQCYFGELGAGMSNGKGTTAMFAGRHFDDQYKAVSCAQSIEQSSADDVKSRIRKKKRSLQIGELFV